MIEKKCSECRHRNSAGECATIVKKLGPYCDCHREQGDYSPVTITVDVPDDFYCALFDPKEPA